MGCHITFSRCCFVAGSLILTLVLVACGISFFGPYWLGNVNQARDMADPYITSYIRGVSTGVSLVRDRPYRGLWAQCGAECTAFWENSYQLQKQKFTPLKWHIATQVLYFVGCTIILASVVFAHIQMCYTREYPKHYTALGVLLAVSVLLQTAALATWGAGAVRDPYFAETNPKKITEYLMRVVKNDDTDQFVYLAWCYWMAVVGDILTLLSSVFFFIASCCASSVSVA
jgi:hypothetical protein